MADYIYDIESYPNCFTCCLLDPETGDHWQFEISQYRNDSDTFRNVLLRMSSEQHRMVGFNNVGFDYPVLHELITHRLYSPQAIYAVVRRIIDTPWDERFTNIVRDPVIPQVDLFLINHFDNVARSTSLKMLEFNMRMENIEDLPFSPDSKLTQEQIVKLHEYNLHDVKATWRFYNECEEMIEFRDKLSREYVKNFTNFNDTKIGKQYFIMKMEEQLPHICYEYGKPRQTIRKSIKLAECIFPWITFKSDAFNRMVDWFKSQTITETKGTFKNLNCTLNGFKFHFGLGGIHGSLDFTETHSDDEYTIIDLDVTSYYPSIAIQHKVYPHHLSEHFCTIYAEMMAERKKHKKGTTINAMLKLALNGVYGDSNNKYGPFFDPKYTMTITLNGQLMLCLLAEWLMEIDCKLLQVNTDGLTIKMRRNKRQSVNAIRRHWEMITGLNLEEVEYKSMYIRDVNNYLAVDMDGKVKRKGAYEYQREWHQNHSALIVPKAAEAYLLDEVPIKDFIMNHKDVYDFMLRVKLPKTMRLEYHLDGEVFPMSNIQRYYISKNGGVLKKVMPPLKGKTDERVQDIESGWLTTPCNDMNVITEFKIDHNYYIEQAEKLVLDFKNA